MSELGTAVVTGAAALGEATARASAAGSRPAIAFTAASAPAGSWQAR